MTQALHLDGHGLDLDGLLAAARGVAATVSPDALARAESSHRLAAEVSARQPVYGRTTGVGAARDESTSSSVEHGLRLLRSHAAGWGEVIPGPVVRAALAVRANQLLAGGSGANPQLAQALAELVGGDEDNLPVVHRYGSLGTGDLTALAEVGLALIGERERADGGRLTDLKLTSADALPLMSSNAFAIAETGLHAASLHALARAADTVCGLSFVALRGNPEAVSETAAAATPFRGAQEVARVLRELLDGQPGEPAHIQDFFGLRTWPQVHGPVLDTVTELKSVVEVAANTASENPLFTVTRGGGAVTHHGGFHAAYLVLAVDSTLLALTLSAQAVQSRISHILTDSASGLPLFLSDATAGSSGVLIAEYVAASALSTIRGVASTPSSVQTAGVSAGIEDDASFAGQATVRLGDATTAYRRMLAVELVCAVRALRMRGVSPVGELGEALRRCASLPAGMEDRDLSPELVLAERMVEGFAVTTPEER
ncbi:aromatic amino acid ammonia-lyase [Pedococcus sp. 5OH_020]|uniref:aromatic amino acid ammonia-lyase n=1 Tax=Pedococcus sp. 5OH_020 TaxID=2989814 RepID=UPI0022E9A513|nr:aromatic amino acid ammonia-lyase [Pedococcus sp. 5OH_020]